MVQSYSLLRPVIGFFRDDRQVVTMPAGTLIELLVRQPGVGITHSLFEGRPIMVQYEDIESNGMLVEVR
jgi:hypothetical protein